MSTYIDIDQDDLGRLNMLSKSLMGKLTQNHANKIDEGNVAREDVEPVEGGPFSNPNGSYLR